MASTWDESQMVLALQARQKNPKLSIRKAAEIYEVPRNTLAQREKGSIARSDIISPTQKLSKSEEQAIIRYVIDLVSRSFPPRLSGVEDMANRLLRDRDAGRVGVNWASSFVRRQPELKTRFSRGIDYQRVLCEDPDKYHAWFILVQGKIAEYGVQEDDIYNFDETGFMMGQICPEMVVTTSDRRGRPRAAQQGNREWTTVIQGISARGYAIPPYIIVAGLVHLSSWYEEIGLPGDWRIATTKNGWTTNERGVDWIRHFDRHTKSRTKGVYRILILDGHESHHSTEFELFCKENNIITLGMPAHSSHRLQPLDVGCFRPLKRAYSQEIEGLMRAHITHISKEDFLPAFYRAFQATFTEENIIGGWRGSGLVPYDPDHVISQLDAKLRTPTPPGSSSGLPLVWESKTPTNPTEAHSQTEYIKNRIARHQNSSPTSVINSISQFAKGATAVMHELILLRGEVADLRKANETLSRRRRTKKKQLRHGGSLTIQEGQDLKSQMDASGQLREETRQNGGRTRRVETRRRRCRICGEPGHNARTCQNDVETSGEDDSD